MVASFRKKVSSFEVLHFPRTCIWSGGKGGCTFASVKCLLLVVIWQFFLCGYNFSCSWQHCIQISQIRVWSARNDATSDNWVLPIIKCPPVLFDFRTNRLIFVSSLLSCSSVLLVSSWQPIFDSCFVVMSWFMIMLCNLTIDLPWCVSN